MAPFVIIFLFFIFSGLLSAADKGNLISEKVQSKESHGSSFNKPIAVPKKVATPFVPKQTEVTVDAGLSAMQNVLNNNTIDADGKNVASVQQINSESATIRGYPKNLPHLIILTGTYSAVFICILLISRSLPTQEAGKLYIHFTAFWSLLLYFLTDREVNDYYAKDPLDNVVESFAMKNKYK